MALQIEKMNFEKYKIHYDMFNDMLDKLERDSRGNKTFASRSILYKKLFPLNTFEVCRTHATRLPGSDNGLNHIKMRVKNLVNNLKASKCQKDFIGFMGQFTLLNNELNIITLRDSKPGDVISDEKYIVFNIAEVQRDVRFVMEVVSTLASFCGEDISDTVSALISTKRLILNCEKHFQVMGDNAPRNTMSTYSYVKATQLSIIINIYHCLQNDINAKLVKPLEDFLWISLSSLNAPKLITHQGCKKFISEAQSHIAKAEELHAISCSAVFEPYRRQLAELEAINDVILNASQKTV